MDDREVPQSLALTANVAMRFRQRESVLRTIFSSVPMTTQSLDPTKSRKRDNLVIGELTPARCHKRISCIPARFVKPSQENEVPSQVVCAFRERCRVTLAKQIIADAEQDLETLFGPVQRMQ